MSNEKSKDAKRQEMLAKKEREINYWKVAKKGYLDSQKVKIAPQNYIISLQNIQKIYPNYVQAVYDFNLDIKDREFIVFVGPSGCGKSTTLRMIAGLEDITAGDLYMNHRYSNDLEPKKRNISMVFQSYALYPNMTVRENLSFGLKIQHARKEEIKEKVEQVAETLQLSDYLDRKPSALSGGQRQRVALGRALVKASPIFLMDEPLSNLDAKLRVQMRSEIVSLHKKVGATTIYVTHDQTEAMTMADRIVVMSKGRIQQIGTPEEVYSTPNNLFVATFIGSPAMNITDAMIHDGKIIFEDKSTLPLTEERKKMVEDFIHAQICHYEKAMEDVQESIEKRKKYLTNKAERYRSDAFDAMERKYAKKENVLRINIANLKKAYDDGDVDGTKEGAMELQKKLDMVLENKEKECVKIEEKYQMLLEKNSMVSEKEKSKMEMNVKKDEEMAVYHHQLENFERKIRLYQKALETKALKVKFGIRPEDIKALSNEENHSLKSHFVSKISLVELLGYEYYLYFDFHQTRFIAKANHGKYRFQAELEEKFHFDEEKIHLFDEESELRIF